MYLDKYFLFPILVAVVYFDLVGQENILKSVIFHSILCEIVEILMVCSGETRPSDKGVGRGGGLKKNFFQPFGPQFGLKISGGGGKPPGLLP